MALDLEELIASVERGELALETWSVALDWATAERLRRAARAALDQLPVPIRAAVDGPPVQRRRALERILGHLQAREGDYRLLTRSARVAWLRGGSHVEYLKVLARAGREQDAAGLARTLMSRTDEGEREELQKFLSGLSRPPEDWEELVARLADNPTEEAWDALLRFTPQELRAERQRYTVHLLLRLGVDEDHIFRLAARHGVSSEIIAMVEAGRVDPRVIESHAEAQPETRQMWLGYAARAACVLGDRLGTLRLLRLAHVGVAASYVESDLRFIAENADDALREILEKAGVELPDG